MDWTCYYPKDQDQQLLIMVRLMLISLKILYSPGVVSLVVLLLCTACTSLSLNQVLKSTGS